MDTEVPRLLTTPFVVMRGVVKVTIVICSTILASKGLLSSGDVTSIYAIIVGIGPVEHLAAGLPELKAREIAIKADKAPQSLIKDG